MANGASTIAIQQALQALLRGQNPISAGEIIGTAPPVPFAPVGNLGPLNLETTAALRALNPEPVPPALPSPVDADAIRARIMALRGPEPAAPVAQPVPLIQKIALALQGFGAGVQGQGPQFLAELQRQRELPKREYEAKRERYETRGQELGLIGEQAVLSAEDRRAARTLELLDRQSERDYQRAARESGIKSVEARERMREAFRLELEAKKGEIERAQQERKEMQARKVQVANLANTLTDDFKISREQARRFAEFELNDVQLSAADAKQYSRIEKYRRPVGGTGAGQPKVLVEIANPDGSVSVVPLTGQVSSGINAGTISLGPRGVFMAGQQSQPAAGAAPDNTGRGVIDYLTNQPATQRQPAKPGTVFTRAEIEAHAKRTKRDPKAVEADIKARGGIVQ